MDAMQDSAVGACPKCQAEHELDTAFGVATVNGQELPTEVLA
jgi:hypothetical protein